SDSKKDCDSEEERDKEKSDSENEENHSHFSGTNHKDTEKSPEKSQIVSEESDSEEERDKEKSDGENEENHSHFSGTNHEDKDELKVSSDSDMFTLGFSGIMDEKLEKLFKLPLENQVQYLIVSNRGLMRQLSTIETLLRKGKALHNNDQESLKSEDYCSMTRILPLKNLEQFRDYEKHLKNDAEAHRTHIYLDNCGNSRANTCEPEFRPEMEGTLLLDQNQSVAGSLVHRLPW
ncbi:hypothetical protein TKK_0011657, partial [Trichogramma kaykai]